MEPRLPAQPPVLPGFEYLSELGAGSFADVFLYQQKLPRRHVAVKAMLAEAVDEHVRHSFQAEADLMAQLSAHPSILTVYQASVSSDGRPYLVMELCSSSLSERYRNERLSVAEVLRVAVKIGSALETAHRAGVLHRDVKPSNILLTAYGHPVLSDFGIASALSGLSGSSGNDSSIPWTAPEVLRGETTGSIESEIWSLAATIYSLLTGRTPFEISGETTTTAELVERICTTTPQLLGRRDAPASLEKALARAMSRLPENRHSSVFEFIQELQKCETERGFAQTQAEVATDEWALATVAELGGGSRTRGSASAGAGDRRRRAAVHNEFSQVENLNQFGGSVSASAVVRKPRARSRGFQILAWGLVAVAVAAIAFAAVVTLVILRDSARIAVVSDVTARVDGTRVSFDWPDPGLMLDDSYQIEINGASHGNQSSTSFHHDSHAGARVCLIVTVIHDRELGEPSLPACVDIPE